jgi:excinuclease ABC subunit C
MGTSNALQSKLKKLPLTPGVYFFKDSKGKIIYIGKASRLKRRVSSYFQKVHTDYKTPLLVKNIADLEWIEANSEIEALFLEAEFIKRHKPLYNVRERDDKNFLYIKITTYEDFPTVSIIRRPSDDMARYFGPFVQAYSVRQALKYLRKIFPYYVKGERKISSKLEYQIGVVPQPDITKREYRLQIRRLIGVLEGKSEVIAAQLEREMKKLAKAKQYEEAAKVRNQYTALKGLKAKIVFGREETFDLSLDVALHSLAERLGLSAAPRRMECYDISNFAGGDSVSSMVVFTDGVPDQKAYRHFKMRTKGPNDFAMMHETLSRRFSGRHEDWPKPDLIIIDGGKGQLTSAQAALSELGIALPMVGLAKRYETIVQQRTEATKLHDKSERFEGGFKLINFEPDSPTLHLLQRIRDEAHRFAVSYHTNVRNRRTKSSLLDSIPGVGPMTRKKLIRSFGSVAGVSQATQAELVACVGSKLASQINEALAKS